jgi:glycosyltransferase involved in cell wall biosynthesis
MSIGGSLFVHNAVEFDYCISEAIESLVPFCDEVVVLDAQSTDDTVAVLKAVQSKYDHVRVIEGAEWACADNYLRLSKLANLAKNYLNTEWHFMLQADEVVHENSYPAIKEFFKSNHDSAIITRLNLWGDFGTYVNPRSERLPCSPAVIRMGRIYLDAQSDGESFDAGRLHANMTDRITLFHYGFLRNNMLNRVIAVQSWFWGPNSQPDARCVRMKKEDGIFKPYEFIAETELLPIPMPHPAVMEMWIQDRQHRTVRT